MLVSRMLLGRAQRAVPAARLLSRSMATYELKVYTGDARGAATKADVSVVIIGSTGKVRHELETGHFERDSVDSFEVEVPESVGEIQRIRIGHNEDGLGSGWFLDHVELAPVGKPDARPADHLAFPCNAWLGESDSGGISGPPVVSLAAARKEPSRISVAKSRRARAHPALRMVCAPACLPHPDKVLDGARGSVKRQLGHGGEDAYFIAPGPAPASDGDRERDASQKGAVQAFGVADGVWGWRQQGIDSGIFSRGLMQAALDEAERQGGRQHSGDTDDSDSHSSSSLSSSSSSSPSSSTPSPCSSSSTSVDGLPPTRLTPLHLLEHAAEEVVQGQQLQGSSTVVAVSSSIGSGVVSVANLGDSGVMVLRRAAPDSLRPIMPLGASEIRGDSLRGAGGGGGSMGRLAMLTGLGGRVDGGYPFDIIYRTRQQEHQFGYPFQIGHHERSDAPGDAELF
eukprot:g5047.t1